MRKSQPRKADSGPTFDWLPTASARTLSLPEQIAEQVGNAIIKGLIEPGQPRRGAQVTRLNIDEVNEIFEIRSALFGLAARLLATRTDDEARQRLRAGVEELQSLAQGEHADEYVGAVYRLNMTVAEASGNRRLRATMFSLAHQTLRYSRLGLATEKRRQQSARNWRRLATAIQHEDAAAAAEIAQSLVTQSRDMAVRLLREEEKRAGESRAA
jgi:DNA-binding GntR family transcriptional regulator